MSSSGQQKGQDYAQRVVDWITQRDIADDFVEYQRNGKINRQALCAELDFGRSVVSQNPAVRSALEEAEQRWFGVKHRNDIKAQQAAVERSERRVAKSNNDVNKLLDQIAKLSAENALLRKQLQKYEVMSEILAETGFVPR